MAQHQQQQCNSNDEENNIHPLIRYPIRNLIRHQQESSRGGSNSVIASNDYERKQQELEHGLLVIQYVNNANRRDVQYLVDFLQARTTTHQEQVVVATKLELHQFQLLQPSDGGLNVLCDYFANQASITTVELAYCHFGGMEEASRLLAAAFATNHTTTVTDLTIREIRNLQGAALGDCISGILQNNTTVQLLSLGDTLDVETVRSMQPGLRTNRHLKVLDVSYCSLRDEGLHLIVDALVGNTSMEGLSIRSNAITSNGGGLDDITRLLDSTQLQWIDFTHNDCVFDDYTATQNFAHALSRNSFVKILRMAMFLRRMPGDVAAMIFRALESNTTLEQVEFGEMKGNHHHALVQLVESIPRMKGLRRLGLCRRSTWKALVNDPTLCHRFARALHENTSIEKLLGLYLYLDWPAEPEYPAATRLEEILTRNCHLNWAKDLLAPRQPGTTGQPIAAKSGIWCNAFARLAPCAIFHIFQTRPTLLEKQLRRPRPSEQQQQQAVSHQHQPVAAGQQELSNNLDNNSNNNSNCSEPSSSEGRKKRARLSK